MRTKRGWRRATIAVALAAGCGSNSPLPPLDLNGAGGADAGSRVEPGGSPDASLPFDGGSERPPGTDASGTDATPGLPDAGADAPPGPDAAPEPGVDAGTLLLSGTNLYPLLITSDALVVFGAYPAGNPGIYAVPLAGGAQILIDTQGKDYVVDVFGPNVLTWEVSATNGSVGRLSIWSRSRAAVLAASSLARGASANADGSEISFSQNVTDTQLDIALLAGDAGPNVLLSGIQRASCASSSSFVGSTLLVQHCDTPLPDGGAHNSQPPTLTAFYDGGARADLGTLTPDPPAFGTAWRGASSASLVYASLNGPSPTAAVIALASGTKTVIDPEGEEGFLVPDGSAVIYRSKDKLRRSATASASPIDLATTGSVSGLLGLSTDGSVVAYFNQSTADPAGYSLTDLGVSTTLASGSVTHQVVTTPTAYFSGFTANASHVIYWSAVDASTGFATLAAAPTDAGGAARVLGTSVLAWARAIGSKIVFADNCHRTTLLCDVHVADLATGASPALVAPSANANQTGAFALTSDGSSVVYGSNQGTPGIYVAPLP